MDPTDIEIALLLEGIVRQYGYDFRGYAEASLKRRVMGFMRAENLATVSGLQERVLHNPASMERLLRALSVDTSAMFRDPGFYRSFRQDVVPLLRTYPFCRIWHAGCAAGQEAYSMAILLQEEDLYDRCRVYATDVNDLLLTGARSGTYPMSVMKDYTANYQRAGGSRAFSEYYTADADHVVFHPSLQRNIVWAQHNLVTDGVFNTFHVILCRNVMIYFGRPLQERVHRLLYDSLEPLGILGLGSKESTLLHEIEACYEAVDERARLYRKVQ